MITVSSGVPAVVSWDTALPIDADSMSWSITAPEGSGDGTKLVLPENTSDNYVYAVWMPPTGASGTYEMVLSYESDEVSRTSSAYLFIAPSDSYVDVAEFKSANSLTTTETDSRIASVLAGVSSAVEQECGSRSFRLSESKTVEFELAGRYEVARDGMLTIYTPDIAFPDPSQVVV